MSPMTSSGTVPNWSSVRGPSGRSPKFNTSILPPESTERAALRRYHSALMRAPGPLEWHLPHLHFSIGLE
jgi:hypothetical protein